MSDCRTPDEEDRILSRLSAIVPSAFRLDVDLSTLTRWRIGGIATALIEPRTVKQLSSILSLVRTSSLPFVVVGETSNLLFDSAGFDGLIIRVGAHLSRVAISGRTVIAEAGVSVPMLARTVAEAGLTGLEHAVGIPGTLGGLVTMNGGSLRQSIGSRVKLVSGIDHSGHEVALSADDCQFAHRHSAIAEHLLAVTRVTLELESDNVNKITSRMEEILASRARKFPVDAPSCGSTFVSDPDMYSLIGPPGQAIEDAGLKGARRGNAEISRWHANFFVNQGNASSDDILWLIAAARQAVRVRTGFSMSCEARYVSPSGDVVPAHVAAERRWGRIEDLSQVK